MATKKAQSRRQQEEAREQAILRAALTELALFDYGGLTIEQVANRARVNKTTVYRKWPTKSALVRAALTSVFQLFTLGPSSGDLRSDLRRIAHRLIAFIESSEGKSLLRLRLLQHPEPELADIAKQLRAQKADELAEFMQSAVVRGELSPQVDVTLLLDMLWGVLFVKLVLNRESITASKLESILDLLLTAASHWRSSGTKRPANKPRRR